MKMIKNLMLTMLILSTTSVLAEGLSGTVYSDYYYHAKSHSSTYAGQHGLNFRRIYLTYKKDLDEGWSAKFRYEMANDALGGTSMTPAVKDMYLAKKMGNHKMLVGISSDPAFSFMEGHWGYRSVEKNPLDLYKFRSSRDTGIAFKGKVNSMLDYHFMYGNNSSNKSESNRNKRYALSAVLHPMSSVDLELNYDMADSLDKKSDENMFKVFAAWTGEKAKLGVMFAKLSKKSAGVESKATVVSVHSTYKLCKKMTLLARFDSVKYDDAASTSFSSQSTYLPINSDAKEFTTLIAGLDYKAGKKVSIIPNIELVNYKTAFTGKTTDVNDAVARVTFAYKF